MKLRFVQTCALLIGILALAACANPQVTLPAGAACISYANARADYAVAKVLATQLCRSDKLPADACESLKAIDVRAKVYRDTVEKALLDPTQPVDWAQVLSRSEEIIGILMRISP